VARTPRQASIELTTPYQTVLLTNGQILFGKLDQPAAAHPVLRNVFYLQSQANPETRQLKTLLVKRGPEPHEPDETILNGAQILLIEPVKPGSAIGKMIEESTRK
jgi:hypothetical protein